MSKGHSSIIAYNEKSLRELIWEMDQEEFKLVLAHCNYLPLRQQILKQLKQTCSIPIREIQLKSSVKQLYSTLKKHLGEEQPDAVMVLGLELVTEIEKLLTSVNQVREDFRKNFHFPLVIWITDKLSDNLIRLSPDFESWATRIVFKMETSELLEYLQNKTEHLFEEVLETGDDCFLSTEYLFSESDRAELKSVLSNLADNNQNLASHLEACLEFIQGRDSYAKDDINKALRHYQRSIAFWRKAAKEPESYPFTTDITPELREGVIFSNIGLCHYRNAELERTQAKKHWKRAKHYFKKCINVFEQAQQLDLVAKFISQLGDALRHLEEWDNLEQLVHEYKRLHEDKMPGELAQDYGFLSEVALTKQSWNEAKKLAEKALKILENVPEKERLLSHQSQYLLLLARSLLQLDQVEEATQRLEQAAAVELEDNAQLYIEILEQLRSLYLEQRNYHKAFKIKQKLRSFAYQYGFRAFIGAGRLRPQKPKTQVRTIPFVSKEYCHVPKPKTTQELTDSEWEEYVRYLIETSGRQSINKLINRVSDTQHKLTVIHGQSGVGKSSLIHAVLVPALKHRSIGIRDFLPVTFQVYADWQESLGIALAESLTEKNIRLSSIPNSVSTLIKELQKNEERNLQTVLIIDPFEDFFFVDKISDKQKNLKEFFEFLGQCLELPFIKVIFSIREDYLHHLLLSSRQTNLEAINNDILSKDVLLYLANFSIDEAHLVIKSLTERSQLNLAPELIQQLVQDLAELEPQGEVRPVELQVVGAALQDAKITTLEQYQSLGKNPKIVLVDKYLDAVFEDCGGENKQLVLQVLKHLIDENGHRPFRTKSQLGLILTLPPKMLDLILEILEGNNIVFRFRTETEDQYQLVHDYLVEPIQQKIRAEQDRTAEITLLEKVIHNLRTPLTAIIEYSEMLSEDENLQVEPTKVLQKITTIGRTTIEELSDIRNLSKLELGTLQLYRDPEKPKIFHLVNNVIATLEEKQKLNLKVLDGLKNSGKMDADVIWVRQCLTNLLNNALQLAQQKQIILKVDRYTYNGKEWINFKVNIPELVMTSVEIQQLFQATTHDISVSDTSIPPQAIMARKLTITKKICELMGGSFKLESQPDIGSTFTMELPAYS